MYRCFSHSRRGCYSWRDSESDVAQRINSRGRTIKYLSVLETDARSSEEWARKSSHLCLVWDCFGLREVCCFGTRSHSICQADFEVTGILLSWNYRHKPPGPDTIHVLDRLEELPTLRRPFWELWGISSIDLQASSRATVLSDSSMIRWTFLYPLLAARIPAGAHTVLPKPASAAEETEFPQDCVRCPWYPTICFIYWITEDDKSDSS